MNPKLLEAIVKMLCDQVFPLFTDNFIVIRVNYHDRFYVYLCVVFRSKNLSPLSKFWVLRDSHERDGIL